MADDYRNAPARPAAVAAEAMVATSQPHATRAGLRALERGGNAADAAIAAAAALCVTEPMSTGIGGDCFAIVWRDGAAEGLDSAGAAPAGADPSLPVERFGPRSITVPGAVRGWAALAERHGRLGLGACLADAIDLAERGFAIAPRSAAAWQACDRAPASWGPAPHVGELVRLPELAATLRLIADQGPDALYTGRVAAAIAAASWLEESDLAAHQARWVEPLAVGYRGHTVLELPPPGQGFAAAEGLALLELGEATLPEQIDCVRLALDDAFRHVRDGADLRPLLEPERLAARRREAPPRVREPEGGTVYLCAVDGDGMAVSFIQSLFYGFGSGVLAPGTGVVLQNRGACFAVNGAVEPGRRPYHTIIPGLLVRDGALAGPFGVMGGFLQAQAHVQLVSALVDRGLDPQAALDRGRFCVDGDRVLIEEPLWEEAAGSLAGYDLVPARLPELDEWGGGQAIMVAGDVLIGGSDARKDGYAAGF